MTDALQVFNSPEFGEVRTCQIAGEPWFIASDVAKALGYSKTSAMTRILDADEKGVHNLHTLGGDQQVSIVSESGLYSAILRSRIPAAKQFKRWVTHEILPTIRRHGMYATDRKLEELLADPDAWIKTLETLKAERAERKRLENEAEANKPKVIFADAVETAKTSILVGQLAKILAGNGVNVGQNRLFAWLRRDGFLMDGNRSDRNMPSQKSMRLELMEVKETTIVHATGYTSVNMTPKITGKGQTYLTNYYLKKEGVIQ